MTVPQFHIDGLSEFIIDAIDVVVHGEGDAVLLTAEIVEATRKVAHVARAMSETGSIYTRDELKRAFDVVAPSNWKDEIDTEVLVRQDVDAELDRIREAVIFYTGSVPTITLNRRGYAGAYFVRAAGYYRTIGA